MPVYREGTIGARLRGLIAWSISVTSAGLLAALLAVQPVAADELTLDTRASLTELETELAARQSSRGLDAFALGAVSFLRAIEVTLQDRYRTRAAIGSGGFSIPVLRLPVPPNPQPEPFQPEFVAALFSSLGSDMEQTRAHLASADIDPDDRLVLDVAALWFDIDGNGTRGIGEGVLETAGLALGGAMPRATSQVPFEGLVVHFDAADVEWLVAYTHLLSAVSEMVLAFDPTEVIADVMESNVVMAKIQGGSPPKDVGFLRGEEVLVDTIAIVYGALNRVPERERIAEARDHLLEMIERNRAFWALVEQETDNSFEWIPNPRQNAALGFNLPSETSSVWQRVLADAEAVLKGELLVSHWRTDPGGGINVAKLVADPPAFDIVTWIQGAGLAPYVEPGPLVTGDSYNRFTRMFGGNAMLFMVLLN